MINVACHRPKQLIVARNALAKHARPMSERAFTDSDLSSDRQRFQRTVHPSRVSVAADECIILQYILNERNIGRDAIQPELAKCA